MTTDWANLIREAVLQMSNRMTAHRTNSHRDQLTSMYHAALAAVDPFNCVRAVLSRKRRQFVVDGHNYSLGPSGRLFIVGMGKASAQMAAALEAVVGDLVAEGIVITSDGSATTLTSSIKVLEGAHPVPDERCVTAAQCIAAIVDGAGMDDIVFVLISGGGSSLLTLPADGLSLDDVVETNKLLLLSGATISEMNTVRKHLSALKGGWLALRAYPARVIALVLSDVVGNPLDVIASGPTVADPSTFGDAKSVLHRYELWELLPQRVRQRLDAGEEGEVPETPKPGQKAFSRLHNVIVGSGAHAALAATSRAKSFGYQPLLLTTSVVGEARGVGSLLGAIGRELVLCNRPFPPPVAVVMAGETTVTVRGCGRGGRNQEVALAAAMEITGLPGCTVAALGTDGVDGPTDAAGAIVDGRTLERIGEAAHSAQRALDANDAYTALAAAGDLVITGPTGTNVADLYMLLASSGSS